MEIPDQIRVGFSINGKSRRDPCWIFHQRQKIQTRFVLDFPPCQPSLMIDENTCHSALGTLVALQNVEDMDHCHKHVQSRSEQWMAALICLQNLHPHLVCTVNQCTPTPTSVWLSPSCFCIVLLYYCTLVLVVINCYGSYPFVVLPCCFPCFSSWPGVIP